MEEVEVRQRIGSSNCRLLIQNRAFILVVKQAKRTHIKQREAKRQSVEG